MCPYTSESHKHLGGHANLAGRLNQKEKTMSTTGKRYKASIAKLDPTKQYPPEEAVSLVKDLATAKFNETVELHLVLGIDPKRSDQNVRGTVVLPHGTGKTPKVIAFAKG